MSKDETNQENGNIFVVGIAASAGGLEAASLLAQNLPKSANAIYVLAQHMSPTHKSLLTSLISRETELPVVEIEGEVDPEPNTIYVTPPNSDIVLQEGKLLLLAPSGHPVIFRGRGVLRDGNAPGLADGLHPIAAIAARA